MAVCVCVCVCVYTHTHTHIYIAFVDLLKAFDNANWNIMMKILKMIKIDYRDRRIIRELYKHQMTFIKINESKEKLQLEKE